MLKAAINPQFLISVLFKKPNLQYYLQCIDRRPVNHIYSARRFNVPTIQIRTDDKTKTASTALFEQLGITMSKDCKPSSISETLGSF